MKRSSVTIVICTRNRAASLRETLAALARSGLNAATLETEVLIIDNGSTDETREVVADFRRTHAKTRYLHHDIAGLSRCRNLAVQSTTTDLILFTDDDVRFPSGWVENMCRPILADQADAVAGGVTIAPHLQYKHAIHPAWFASTESIPGEKEIRMVGANMAIRTSTLRSLPPFDIRLGAGALGFHEETLLTRQLIRRGFIIQPLWHVAVEHHFCPTKLSREAILRLCRSMASSDAYVDYHYHHLVRNFTVKTLARHTAGLLARRLWSRIRRSGQEHVEQWEVDRIRAIAYMKQFRKECRDERRYLTRELEVPLSTLPL